MNIESMSTRELDKEANYLFRCLVSYDAYETKVGNKAKSKKALGQIIEKLSAENRKRQAVAMTNVKTHSRVRVLRKRPRSGVDSLKAPVGA
jgi:hypothetical protein